MTSKPWEPASLLVVKDKDANYTYRWCSKDLLEKRIAEGWEVVRSVTQKVTEKSPAQTLMDGKSVDSTIQKRNLILCRMPKDMAVQRNEYFRKLDGSRIQQATDDFKNVAGKDAYGTVETK